MDDYKQADAVDKDVIFNAFMDSIWNCGNERRYQVKKISYTVQPRLLDTAIGRIFEEYSVISYKAPKLHSNDASNYAQYIRQKINNLYTTMCDQSVCTRPEYIEKLKQPKTLYYRYLQGEEYQSKPLRQALSTALNEAKEIKLHYSKQKMDISWTEYCSMVAQWLKRCFNNYRSEITQIKLDIDVVTEDHYCIAYFCKSLNGEMLKYQKKYYGVREHKRYGRCKDCGCLYERKNKDTNSIRCEKCRQIYRREYQRLKQREYARK